VDVVVWKQELEAKLRVEMESYEAEREQWKTSSLETMKRLSYEEEQGRIYRKKAHDQAANVLKLSEANLALESERAQQDRRLAQVIDEYAKEVNPSLSFTFNLILFCCSRSIMDYARNIRNSNPVIMNSKARRCVLIAS
jgi:hypothetical protein